MKKQLLHLFLCLAFIAPVVAFKPEKEKTVIVKMTEQELQDIWGTLNGVQSEIDASSMPHDKVKRMVGNLEGVKKFIADQVNPQLQDSTVKKK